MQALEFAEAAVVIKPTVNKNPFRGKKLAAKLRSGNLSFSEIASGSSY